MKILKSTLILLFLTLFVNCSKNEVETPFVLSAENIAGTYNMSFLDKEITTTTVVAANEIKISDEKITGDVFKLVLTIQTNGTFTLSGSYTVKKTLTPVGSSAIDSDDIIIIEDSGAYSVNAVESKMTFTSSTNQFLNGLFEISNFNQNSFTIQQEFETVVGLNTSTTNATYSFTRN